MVLFNRGEEPYEWQAPRKKGTSWELALLSDEAAEVDGRETADGFTITLPPLTAAVLVSQSTDE
jgi:hypothetical protein